MPSLLQRGVGIQFTFQSRQLCKPHSIRTAHVTCALEVGGHYPRRGRGKVFFVRLRHCHSPREYGPVTAHHLLTR